MQKNGPPLTGYVITPLISVMLLCPLHSDLAAGERATDNFKE